MLLAIVLTALFGPIIGAGVGAGVGDPIGRASTGAWLGALLGPLGWIIVLLMGRTPKMEAEYRLEVEREITDRRDFDRWRESGKS